MEVTEKLNTAIAKARFAELLRRVRNGESFVIQNHNLDIALLTPLPDQPKQKNKKQKSAA